MVRREAAKKNAHLYQRSKLREASSRQSLEPWGKQPSPTSERTLPQQVTTEGAVVCSPKGMSHKRARVTSRSEDNDQSKPNGVIFEGIEKGKEEQKDRKIPSYLFPHS